MRQRRTDIRALLESGVVIWSVVAVVLVFALARSADFRTVDNLSNLSRQFAVLALVSLGQLLVVISAGVDLSLATNVRLGAIAAAIVMNGSDRRLVPGVAAGLGVGLAVGLFNGVVVTRLRIEPFITTLGTSALLGGLALYVASTPQGRSAPALNSFYGWKVGPVFGVVLVVAAVWLVVGLALRRTAWGRHVYAVGGDPAVARLSGVRVRTVQASVFVVSGLLGGVAAVITLGSTGVGDPASGTGLEFDSLAAVVIGGASLSGGRGRLTGALGGVVLFSILGNVFNLLQVDVWYQQLTRGVIILVAASLVVARRSGPRSGTGSQLQSAAATHP
jgi:ribose transport system permease protein